MFEPGALFLCQKSTRAGAPVPVGTGWPYRWQTGLGNCSGVAMGSGLGDRSSGVGGLADGGLVDGGLGDGGRDGVLGLGDRSSGVGRGAVGLDGVTDGVQWGWTGCS